MNIILAVDPREFRFRIGISYFAKWTRRTRGQCIALIKALVSVRPFACNFLRDKIRKWISVASRTFSTLVLLAITSVKAFNDRISSHVEFSRIRETDFRQITHYTRTYSATNYTRIKIYLCNSIVCLGSLRLIPFVSIAINNFIETPLIKW